VYVPYVEVKLSWSVVVQVLMDEASIFDRWYSVEQYAVVPPREVERSEAEVVGRDGAMATCSGPVEMFSLCISVAGTTEL
jgi:hypothetical protein